MEKQVKRSKARKPEKDRGLEKEKKRLVLVRVRGKTHVRKGIEDTLKHLNLNRVNSCVVIDNRKQYVGMINKVNDYVTWGEISADTFKKLLKGRGTVNGGKLNDAYVKEKTSYGSLAEFSEAFMKFETGLDTIPEIKPVFRLSPPLGGHERGGIKKPIAKGGVLGYRGKDINKLIIKMI
ncbi:MAG: 50S ribosomal protein L30 [Candidatus Altiarchaeota archaeon]|nr:50S ribosomal protein L30 [Candidatus Altiarchaeota archaeon]